jgi:hypothetical protein
VRQTLSAAILVLSAANLVAAVVENQVALTVSPAAAGITSRQQLAQNLQEPAYTYSPQKTGLYCSTVTVTGVARSAINRPNNSPPGVADLVKEASRIIGSGYRRVFGAPGRHTIGRKTTHGLVCRL